MTALRDKIIADQKKKLEESEGVITQEQPMPTATTMDPIEEAELPPIIEEPSNIPPMPPITPEKQEITPEFQELADLQRSRRFKRESIDSELSKADDIGPSLADIQEQTNRQIWAKPAQAGLSALGTVTGGDMSASNKAIQGIADAKGSELDQRAKLSESVRKKLLEKRALAGEGVKDFDETESLKDKIAKRLNDADKLKLLEKKTTKDDPDGIVGDDQIDLINSMMDADPKYNGKTRLSKGITNKAFKDSPLVKALTANIFKATSNAINKADVVKVRETNPIDGIVRRVTTDAKGQIIKEVELGKGSGKQGFDDKVAKEEEDKTIPGVGVAITPDDVKIVKNGEALRETAKKAIATLGATFKKWKDIKVKDIPSFQNAYQTKNEIKVIREPILALLRDAANQNLGVVNAHDIPILESQLPNPATMRGWAEGKISNIDFQKQLDLFEELLNQKVIENQRVRLKSLSAPEKLTPNAATQKPSITSSARPTVTQTLPTPEAVIDDSIEGPDEYVGIVPENRVTKPIQTKEKMVEMIAPNGKVGLIPENKVKAAEASGFKRKDGN